MGILIIGINVALCTGGAISIIVSFIWGCLDARKIHFRKKLGLKKRTGEQIQNWKKKSKMNSKIVPIEEWSLEDVRKQYGAASKEYQDALRRYGKQ